MIKKIISYMFITFIYLFLSCPLVNAKEKITLTSVVEGVSNKVNNTFTYKIERVHNYSAINEPNVIDVKFDNVEPSGGKATLTYDIDFSNTTYEKLGVYEYIVSETLSSNAVTFPKSLEKYKIFVEVTTDGTNINKNVHMQALDLNENKKGDLVFSHMAHYTSISIQNEVMGRMVNYDEYFKYKLQINGNINDKYVIIGQDNKVFFDGKWFNTINEYVVSDNNNFAYVYLKGNQKLMIGYDGLFSQIPIGTNYNISKVGSRKWQTSIDGKRMDGTYRFVAHDGENIISIVNKRDFDVALTGIFIDILPFIVLIILGFLGIFIIRKIKGKMDDYDK